MARRYRKSASALFLVLVIALWGCGSLGGLSSGAPGGSAVVEASSSGLPQDAKAGSSISAEAAGDRFAQVFDASNDGGNLVARFLMLRFVSIPRSSEKTGDATILKSPDGKVMLIDAGVPDTGAQVVGCLKALGIKMIDIVLISHPHIDHLGGIPEVLEEFPVGIVYSSKLTHTTAIYNAYMAAITKHGAKIEYLEEGSEFMFGEQVKAKVYNPEKNIKFYEGYPANGTTFMNDRSLVVKFTYGKSSMLFPGDIYVPREVELMKKFGGQLQADVLKVEHHGINTSSTVSFIRSVSPKVAVMINDSLASPIVFSNYEDAGAKAFSTFLDGSVKVSADADGNYETLTQLDRKGNP